MTITQIIATLPAVLNDSETFYEDIAIRNNSLVTVSFPSINTWATQANDLAVEVNDKASEASDSATSAATSVTTATTKANEASDSAISALGYKNDVGVMKLAVETIYDTFEARFSVIGTVDDFGTVPSGIDTVIVKDLNRGGTFIYDATQSAVNNGGTVFDGWVRQYSGAVSVKWFGAKGDYNITTRVGTDDTVAIQLAIASFGIKDSLFGEIYQTARRPIIIPAGNYLISDTILIENHNITINGEGQHNTTLVCSRDVNIPEIIRVQGSYAFSINDITLDGGLLFTPTGTETYGADKGIVFDLATVTSRNLNIMNVRCVGIWAIHLWESYFSNTRIWNTGFFAQGTIYPSAGILFTIREKMDTQFAGGESNNITFNKLSLGTVGSYVNTEVPIYNVFFNDVIAEGRTWNTLYPSAGETKWLIGDASSNVVITNGYTYAHEQSYDSSCVLFNVSSSGASISIKGYRVYQENTLANHYNEIQKIMYVDSSYPIYIDNLHIEERIAGTVTGLNPRVNNLIQASESSNVIISNSSYYSDMSGYTLFDLLTGINYMTGNIAFKNLDEDNNYVLNGSNKNYRNVEGSNYPENGILASGVIDGVNGVLLNSHNISSITKNGVGDYKVIFSTPMVDANFCVVTSAYQITSIYDVAVIGNQINTEINIVVRNMSTGVNVDSSKISFMVSR